MTTAAASTRIQSPHGEITVHATVLVAGAAGELGDDATRAVEAAAARLEALIAFGTWTRSIAEAREEYWREGEGEIDWENSDYSRLLMLLDTVAWEAATDGWAQRQAVVRVDLE